MRAGKDGRSRLRRAPASGAPSRRPLPSPAAAAPAGRRLAQAVNPASSIADPVAFLLASGVTGAPAGKAAAAAPIFATTADGSAVESSPAAALDGTLTQAELCAVAKTVGERRRGGEGGPRARAAPEARSPAAPPPPHPSTPHPALSQLYSAAPAACEGVPTLKATLVPVETGDAATPKELAVADDGTVTVKGGAAPRSTAGKKMSPGAAAGVAAGVLAAAAVAAAVGVAAKKRRRGPPPRLVK